MSTRDRMDFDEKTITALRERNAKLVADFNLMERSYSDAIERNAKLVAALEEIIDPVGVLQTRAKAEGNQLSGNAYEICNSLAYLRDIARRALANPQNTQMKST